MELKDPLRLNDWNIKHFLLVVVTVQFLIWTIVGSNILGISTFFLRQVIGFIYLAYIPGIIILRILRLHNLSIIETLVYSVGLSIAFAMLLGLIMNLSYPIFGFSEPLSLTSLMFSTSIAVLALCVIGYCRDRDFSKPNFVDTKDLSVALALCLLPLLSVLGTYFMNFYDNNGLLLILLAIISIVPILAMFERYPKKLYAITLLVIAISLLYHYSLISTYLTGWDIQIEYYFANLVKSRSYWVVSAPNDYNAMLSIVMLAPIISNLCDMSLIWVFKIVYPLFFSLVPLALYKIFQKQTDEKIAFLSCFLFMAIATFYTEMLGLARQQIGEVFLVLVVMLVFEENLSKTQRSLLGIIFAFSIITSHYSLSYIFILSVLFIWIFISYEKKVLGTERSIRKGILDSNAFVFLFLALILTWYLYVSSSSVLTHGFRIGSNIIRNIADLFNPRTAEGLGLIVKQASVPLHEVTRYMYLFISLAISIGVLAILLKRRETTRLQIEYKLFALINIGMLLAGIALPYFAGALNTSRIYQIALIFLAPLFILGSKAVLHAIGRRVKRSWRDNGLFLKTLAVFLAIFFLFDSGFIYEIARANPTSISLDKNLSFPIFSQQEIIAAEWLEFRINADIPVYSDLYRDQLLSSIFGGHHYFIGNSEITTSFRNETYFFFGETTVKNGQLILFSPYGTRTSLNLLDNMTFYNNTLLRSDKLYDNGDAQTYYYGAQTYYYSG